MKYDQRKVIDFKTQEHCIDKIKAQKPLNDRSPPESGTLVGRLLKTVGQTPDVEFGSTDKL